VNNGGDESFSSMAFGPVGPVGAGLKLQVSSLYYVFSSISFGSDVVITKKVDFYIFFSKFSC